MNDLRILIFAGTYHGRQLCEELLERGATVYVSSFSKMGDDRLPRHPKCHRLIGPVDVAIVGEWVKAWQLDAIIDATHPYAIGVRDVLLRWAKEREKQGEIQSLEQIKAIPILRYERPKSISETEGIFFDSVRALCTYVSKEEGKILFTTGIRQIPEILKHLPKERLIFRILDAEGSIQEAFLAGLLEEQLVIANPPFSVEDTEELIERYSIKYVVTKDGGEVGGTREKVLACGRYGATLLVLERPHIEGMGNYIEEATTSDDVMAWIKQI